MNDDLERQLREALHPVEPPAGFAARVTARVNKERRWQPVRDWTPVALAASVLVSLIVGYGWELRRERQGLEARQQLIEALRLTGEKLDLAYRGVQDASKRPDPGDAGET